MMRDWFLELGMLRTDDEKKAEVEAVMVILVIQRSSLFCFFLVWEEEILRFFVVVGIYRFIQMVDS